MAGADDGVASCGGADGGEQFVRVRVLEQVSAGTDAEGSVGVHTSAHRQIRMGCESGWLCGLIAQQPQGGLQPLSWPPILGLHDVRTTGVRCRYVTAVRFR